MSTLIAMKSNRLLNSSPLSGLFGTVCLGPDVIHPKLKGARCMWTTGVGIERRDVHGIRILPKPLCDHPLSVAFDLRAELPSKPNLKRNLPERLRKKSAPVLY